jgi:HYR domain-containing protein
MKLAVRFATLMVLGVLAAGVLVTASGGAGPAIKVSDVTAEATSSAGASVTFHVKAYDPDTNNAIAATCTPPGQGGSGDFDVTGTFPIAATEVTCTGTLDSGDPASATLTVTVQDTTPPVLTTVSPITESTTDPAGKSVTYTQPTATDVVDGTVAVSCDPPSGSLFAVTTTTVTCTATDSHGNPGTTSFTVTIAFSDTEAPALHVPDPITVTTSGTGATVTYSVTATDNSGNPPVVSCNPASGSTFPVGTTTVSCTASDGTNTSNASFTVTVVFVDTTPPVFSGVPANKAVEANGPTGSLASYTKPTATDAVDGPIATVNCVPASGGTFPPGTTTITCSATDSHGNTGTVSFAISVVDTTPPALYVPLDHSIVATSPAGIASSDPAVVAFVQSARAIDIVDPHPLIIPSVTSILPLGPNTVTFEARDASGNSDVKTATLTVLPVGSTAPPPPPPPRPPVEVTNVKVTPLDGAVRIEWSAGGREVVVVRSTSDTRSLSAVGDEQIVYQGRASRYVDRGLLNGVEYRYLVMALDAAGNRSAGVAAVAVPRQDLLRSPKDGARLRKAPKLTWKLAAEAQYYNAQLFLAGEKILSVWPVRPSYKLKKSWKYAGRKYSLKRGLYTWFVWPGYGPRSRVDYGPMMGTRTFRIVR